MSANITMDEMEYPVIALWIRREERLHLVRKKRIMKMKINAQMKTTSCIYLSRREVLGVLEKEKVRREEKKRKKEGGREKEERKERDGILIGGGGDRRAGHSAWPAGKIHLIDILSDNSLDSKEQINGKSYNSPCHIDDPTDHRFECHSCDSYWWDYDGVPERYTEKDIGVATWNGPTSRLLSFIILVAVIMEVAYDNVYYIGSIWGKQRQIIHAMSYGTFLLQLVFYPILTLAAKIKSWSPSDFLEISWCTVINDRFMVNRLQFLDLPHNGIPMKLVLLLVYVFPIYLVTLRGWIYLQLCSNFSWHSGMSVFCGGFLVLIWGNFQYLLYLTRCSFQRQLHVVLEFIETHQDNTDACRRVLGSVMKDFAVFKKFVDMYMVLMIPTSIWSITTTVVWLYYLSFEKTAAKDSKYYWWFQRELVLLISSENIYHLTLNLWAFGGVNVGYIWNHFYLSLNVAARNSCSKRSFWRKIMRHLKNINLTNYGINFTVILSVLSCFVALELGDKQWTLFVVSEPSCNGTFRFLLN
ncbi:hypothetical protein BSL78_20726 [Apostichopus japonicus]|uniref:Uncharacterized protein n=1 Tax=Stichopus japonicus TaxID=307972 RepID=A0A2G8K366_STIJA|nr:hypothetical protein BSL78_20726 [Apostichopus japonicus]